MLMVMEIVVSYFSNSGFKKLIYRPIPHIYHKLPSEEDLYALFRMDARLVGRNISSTLDLNKPLKLYHDRQTAINKAYRKGVYILPSENFENFWRILESNLWHTHKAVPVHTLEEISSLATSFPEKIKLFGAFIDGEMVAGIVLYIEIPTIHAQYISASQDGKRSGAVDMLVDYLKEYRLLEDHPDAKYFDLGTSNADGGQVLNDSLIYQKEGFGGRGVCYDSYEITL